MKIYARILRLVLTVLFTVSFTTVANAAINYTGEKPIYPAVYQAILNGNKAHWSESKVSVPDPNIIVIEHVRVSDVLKLADFTLRISLENNVVTYQFSNIREKLPLGKDDWARVDKFVQRDREQIFINFFDTEIPKVMGNEALYASAKAAADKSLGGPPGGGALSYTMPLQNPHNYLLYPAVGAAVNNLKGIPGAKLVNLRDIDCLDNKFTISGFVAERKVTDIISYQVKLAYKDNQLNFEISDIKPIGTEIMQFSDKEIGSMPKFDTQKTADQLKAQIEKSLADETVYNAAKKAFLENNDFLNRAFAPVTGVLMDEFTAEIFKGGEIGLSVSISDVKKNDNAEFKDFAFLVSASLFTSPPLSKLFASVLLYTNDTALARLKQSEKLTLSGQFVRLENSTLYTRIIMTK